MDLRSLHSLLSIFCSASSAGLFTNCRVGPGILLSGSNVASKMLPHTYTSRDSVTRIVSQRSFVHFVHMLLRSAEYKIQLTHLIKPTKAWTHKQLSWHCPFLLMDRAARCLNLHRIVFVKQSYLDSSSCLPVIWHADSTPVLQLSVGHVTSWFYPAAVCRSHEFLSCSCLLDTWLPDSTPVLQLSVGHVTTWFYSCHAAVCWSRDLLILLLSCSCLLVTWLPDSTPVLQLSAGHVTTWFYSCPAAVCWSRDYRILLLSCSCLHMK